MPVSHAVRSVLTSTDKQQVPGLLEVLAQVTDPRRKRGRRFTLVFVLAVAVVCVLAGAKNFREIGDQAGDLLQDLLAAFGGKPHPLLRRIIAPGEKRIRTLIQAQDAAALDVASSLLHPGRHHRNQPDSPAHRPRPDPRTAVPSPMTRKSQTTLPTPWESNAGIV